MSTLPANAPDTFEAALERLGSITTPSVDDFKLMVYLEAGGQGFYAGLADSAPSDVIKEFLEKSGREELAHAHRVSRVIEKLSGAPFAVPEPADNPYYAPPQGLEITVDLLKTIAEGEYGGEALYEGWAASVDDEEAAKLLRQNGKEERMHGERAEEIIGLLES